MKTDHKAGEYLFQYHIQPSSMRGNVCKAHNEETTPANSRAHFGDGTQYPVEPSSSEQQDEFFFFSQGKKKITKLPVTSTM